MLDEDLHAGFVGVVHDDELLHEIWLWFQNFNFLGFFYKLLFDDVSVFNFGFEDIFGIGIYFFLFHLNNFLFNNCFD